MWNGVAWAKFQANVLLYVKTLPHNEMMGFTDYLLPIVLVKKLNKPLFCVFTPK